MQISTPQFELFSVYYEAHILLKLIEEISAINHISIERVQINLSDETKFFCHFANYMVISLNN